MVAERDRQGVHQCPCSICQQHPRSLVAREHQAMNRILAIANERMRRLVAGFFARQKGRGGIVELERTTGIDRNTIAKGLREVSQTKLWLPTRIRRDGAGRKTVEFKRPGS
jgi:hypothetical protein